MKDEECVDFLQWALPRLDMRWEGFRKVRDQVCKRVDRRVEELDLPGMDAYRDRLEDDSDEWEVLDGLCRITIFRFRRDREMWRYLREDVLPDLVRRIASEPEPAGEADASPPSLRGSSVPPTPPSSPGCAGTAHPPSPEIRAWSAGCGAGEEPYTLSILWQLELEDRFPDVALRIIATDAEPAVLERARRARYRPATLKELPDEWIDTAFEEAAPQAPERESDDPYPSDDGPRHPEDTMRLRPRFLEPVELRHQDIREEMPAGPIHLVLCRNLVFTYFVDELQTEILEKILGRMAPKGVLVIGGHEELPDGEWPLEKLHRAHPIYRLVP